MREQDRGGQEGHASPPAGARSQPLDAALPDPDTEAVISPTRARIVDVQLSGVESVEAGGDTSPPRLNAPDLGVTVFAEAPPGEAVHLAVMLERSDGVGICAVGTHADHTAPVCLPDGRWRASVRFPDIPLYSGEYMVSAYLFDAEGVNVYDEWSRCARFRHVFATLETGIVRLRHEWS